ncbi:hypothetical protein FDZ71_06915 [bacterium]|nr:MAG: hypothetical protein FDZ71_06915 [bacterium]
MVKKFAIAAVAALALPMASHALEIGVQGTYWMPTFTADLAIKDAATFSATDDFDTDQKVGIPGARAFFGIGDHHISVSAQKAAYKGDYEGLNPISWGGTTILATTDGGEFKYDYTMIDATYQYDLLDLENFAAGFSFGPLFNLKYIDGTAEVAKTTAPAARETQDFTAPIPMVGLGLHIGILMDILEGRAQVAGIGYGPNRVIDGLAEVSVTPFPFLDVSVGYRIMQVKIDYSDVELDLNQTGPYAGLTVSF